MTVAQMKVQSPLANAEAMLKVLTEPILVLDLSEDIALANDAFYDLLQVSPEKFEGVALQELLVEAKEPQLHAILEAVVPLETDLDRKEIRCTIPPDMHKTLSVTVRRMGEDPIHSRVVVVEVRDVTAEKETMVQLQELNQALYYHTSELERINADLESFNRWVSHDLRTPLRFTNTIANRLMEMHDAVLPKDAKKALMAIVDSTEEMGKLIENLLAFSQIDKVAVRKRPINTARLVRETLSDLKYMHNGRDVDIRVDDLPACRADRILLKQVFRNLLENALVFTQPCDRAEIHVGFFRDDAATVYFVRDNGVGFDPSDTDALFAPFRRVSTNQDLQGTGIGLTLVKRIVERHGGCIWAEGEPSAGATFYFQVGT